MKLKLTSKIKTYQYLGAFILVLASVRGFLIYHYNFPAHNIYSLSSSLIIIFGAISFFSNMGVSNDKTLGALRNLIKFNIIFLSIYLLVDLFLLGFNNFSLIYYFMIFPIILSLVGFDRKVLNGIVFTISCLTTFGIIFFLKMGIEIGQKALNAEYMKLRPNDLDFGVSRIGDNLLPGGYQASHHDAANILVMCSSFLLIKILLASKNLDKLIIFLFYFFVTVAALLTGSVTNIIVLLGVTLFSLLYSIKKYPYPILILFMSIFIFTPFIFNFLSDYFYFIEKFNWDTSDVARSERGGMMAGLDFDSIISSIPSLLFGFAKIFDAPMIYTEVAFIKHLILVGLLPFLIFLSICFSPFYYIFRYRRDSMRLMFSLRQDQENILFSNFINSQKDDIFRLVLTSMPVLTGTMTLLHYGSTMRVTSVGLFCVLIAICLQEYLKARRSIKTSDTSLLGV